jgi:AcrR family transcriptional regulator
LSRNGDRPAGAASEIEEPPPGSGAEATTRDGIVEAAKRCFAQFGYRGTSNKKIAAEAGVTTALIYYYFTSKAELFSAVFEQITRERYRRIRRNLRGEPTLVEEIGALVDDLIGLWEHDPSFVRLFTMLPVELRHNPELADALESQHRQLSEVWGSLLAEAEERGQLPHGADAEALAEMFVVWFTGLMNCLVTRGPEPVRAAGGAFMNLVAQNLAVRPVKAGRRRTS